jgi:inorganic triphosphatase YgiF
LNESSTVERELKLVPASDELLDELAHVDDLGPFRVAGRRHERQHNDFFDSASRQLSTAHVGFRRRTVDGQRMARWTLKGESELMRGVASRTEVELQLDAELAPALAVGALTAAARSRGARTLAEAVDDALASGGLPLKRPFIESETDRRIVDLVEDEHRWAIELALDRVRLIGHDYAELEIEAELVRGNEEALEAVRHAIVAMGEVSESRGSKLARAIAHVAHCACGERS